MAWEALDLGFHLLQMVNCAPIRCGDLYCTPYHPKGGHQVQKTGASQVQWRTVNPRQTSEPNFENISYFSMLWTSGNWRNRGEIFPTQEHFLWVNLRSTNSMAGSTRLYSPGRPSVHFYWTCLGPLRHEVHYPGRFKLRGAFGLDKVHR